MRTNITLFISLFFCFVSFSFAQLRIYPEGQNVIASPGATIKGNIWVIGADKKLEVEIQPEDWSKGERKSGVDWLKIKLKSNKFTLKPKKIKEIKWEVKVPKEAEGDLVAQIFFASVGMKFGSVNIGTRVAYSLCITVKGTEKVDAEISNFYIRQESKNYGFAVVFKNKGNVHLTTKGEILLKHLQTGSTKQLELHPWLYRCGESFPLWSWLYNEELPKGNYESTAVVYFTDPTGIERNIKSIITFNINETGEITEIKPTKQNVP